MCAEAQPRRLLRSFTDFNNARSRAFNALGCAMTKLSDYLVIGRASYERLLGTEPYEIAAAAAALRELVPKHPFLIDLDVRLRRARHIKAMLAAIGHSELAKR